MYQVSSVQAVFNEDVTPNGNYNTLPREVEALLSPDARAVYCVGMNRCFRDQRITQALLRILVGEQHITDRRVKRACQELRRHGFARCGLYRDQRRPTAYVGRQWFFFSTSQTQDPEEVARVGAENATGIAIVNARGAGVPCDPVERAIKKGLVRTRHNYRKPPVDGQATAPQKSKAAPRENYSRKRDPVGRRAIDSDRTAYLAYKLDNSPNPSQAPAEHREEERVQSREPKPTGRVFKTLPLATENELLAFGFDKNVSSTPGAELLTWVGELELTPSQRIEVYTYLGLISSPGEKAQEKEDENFLIYLNRKLGRGETLSEEELQKADSIHERFAEQRRRDTAPIAEPWEKPSFWQNMNNPNCTPPVPADTFSIPDCFASILLKSK